MMFELIPFERRMASFDPFRMMADMERSFFPAASGSVSAFRTDVSDEGDAFKLEAELPGVPQEKIQITADHDTLTISAEQNTEKKNAGTFYSERRSGHASRSFRLDGIDQERISAAYANGVLTFTLTKETPSSPAPQRRIPISATEQ